MNRIYTGKAKPDENRRCSLDLESSRIELATSLMSQAGARECNWV